MNDDQAFEQIKQILVDAAGEHFEEHDSPSPKDLREMQGDDAAGRSPRMWEVPIVWTGHRRTGGLDDLRWRRSGERRLAVWLQGHTAATRSLYGS